jgi:hypothetical protein
VGKAQTAFSLLATRPTLAPAAVRDEHDDGGDIRTLPDGRIVPLDWQDGHEAARPVLDRAAPATWD